MVHQRCKQQNNVGVSILCICSSMLLSVWNGLNFSLRKDSLGYNIKFPSFYYSIWEVLAVKRCNTISDTLSRIHRRPSVFQVSGSGREGLLINKKNQSGGGSTSVSSSSGSFWHIDSWYSASNSDLTLSWWVLYLQCAEVRLLLMPDACHLPQKGHWHDWLEYGGRGRLLSENCEI